MELRMGYNAVVSKMHVTYTELSNICNFGNFLPNPAGIEVRPFWH